MEKMKRSVNCGQLRKADHGREVTLNGWIHRLRDHGGVYFINLRDTFGITQVVVDQTAPQEIQDLCASMRMEFCIAVKGMVNARPDNMVNPNMDTGEIEVIAQQVEVLNSCEVLPFMIDEETEANENLRLEYRYLDLRSMAMQDRMKLRSKVTFAAREYLNKEEFLEIETPTLIKSTPEGARDFLVPSRLHPGKFFALPQSPQIYKQMLMVSGFNKYYQVARCYRDEDARGDRQLEFTQIDMEMSFVSQDDVLSATEGMMAHIFKEALNVEIQTPFKRIGYYEAMETYGSDKPDLRFDLPFQDFAPFVEAGEFSVFKSVLESKGAVKALVVPGAASDYSRKKITELEETAKIYGAKGLAWMKVTDQGLDGGISKFYAATAQEVIQGLGAKSGDLILLMGADWKTSLTSLGAVRARLGKDLGLVKPGVFSFAWIVDFPLFEWNEDEEKWDPAHHMFSMPKEQYLETMEENPGEVTGDLYDLVLNGYELASGSIRVHDPELQRRIFSVVGFPEEEAEERFGFMLKSFRYGAPPHGGIAPGLDRLVMIMAEQESLKEVIAFPKNSQGLSPMDDCPARVDEQQLKDLHLSILKEKE